MGIDRSTVEVASPHIYLVRVRGTATVATLDAIDDLIGDRADDDFGVIFLLTEEYESYEREIREVAAQRMRGRVGAMVTSRPTLRMLVSTIGLAVSLKGQFLRAFDELDEAVLWTNHTLDKLRDRDARRNGERPGA